MHKILVFISIFIIFIFSCNKTEIDYSNNSSLNFSTDSLIFDTIFSGIGSVTKSFKIYNKSDKSLIISDIYIGKGSASKYMLNVDGQANTTFKNLQINSNDSIYVFVQVKINTTEDALLEQDSIIFITNNNLQDIKLLAWGQDVHFIDAEYIGDEIWQNDKPYLIYNSMLVEENKTLTIEAGSKLYFHRGSSMYIAGTLEIKGTFEEPVTLQADRLEQMYSDVPGQWDGIWLMNGSKHNRINFAEIKNAVIGIKVDTIADLSIPTLTISNTKIEHMSFAGIYAQGSTVFATNCLIDDCGYYTLALTIGGSYEFYHCTFANYWQNTIRNTPSVILNNYYTYNNSLITRNLDKAEFNNCIIYGNKDNEIYFDNSTSGIFNYKFTNCLLNIDENLITDITKFKNNILNEDPLFFDIENYNYKIDNQSPAKDKASITFIDLYPSYLNFDLNNESRVLDAAPDIGAYEASNL
ncbi:MAG: right-handed parallel beta-helix repeat-containing protein [Bacteroidales bacterium]|nr:right-handed parallel beta-helix repeat-containing protein [Bacteroidales bacterium]MBN2756046.1 right-handed parallel beta-helix repeat-containing protein [Bacteroidales bacterium]